MGQLIALHKIANEVVAKYDFLRSLNPEANLPSIQIEPPVQAASSGLPTASAQSEEGHDQP